MIEITNVRIHEAMIELGLGSSRLSKPLDRTYSGYTLGDHISTVVTSGKAGLLGTDEVGERIYFFSTRHVSTELLEQILYFWHDRLALIKLKHSRSYAGAWRHIVKLATEKNGPPTREEPRRAIWNDGQTTLVLDHDLTASITAGLGQFDFVLKYVDLKRSLAPKL